MEKKEKIFRSNSLVTAHPLSSLPWWESVERTFFFFFNTSFLTNKKFCYFQTTLFEKKPTLLLAGHLDLEGLFLVNGNAERVDWLRQRYDSGEEVELEKEADLASAVSLLRLFLQELPEPVIPTEIQRHILQLHQGVCPLVHIPQLVLLRLLFFHPASLLLSVWFQFM